MKEKNRICVYAICKNEMKYVAEWIDNMSEADYIVVLDTGSTDGTYEYLQNDKRISRVEQKEIKPWRFDAARNESMRLIPEEANILVCTDLDERFNKGWATELRERWEDGKYARAYYLYTWGLTTSGAETDTFIYDKIHTREFHWIYPVHEVLWPIDKNRNLSEDEVLKLDTVKLFHLAERNKNRASYTPLLELSVKENPNDTHCLTLLGREYAAYGRIDEARNIFERVLSSADIDTPFQFNNKMYANLSLGQLYLCMGDVQNAVKHWIACIQIDKTYLDPYLYIAEAFTNIGLYDASIAMVEQGRANAHRHYSWVEGSYVWVNQVEDVLSRNYYYKENYTMAINLVQQAINKNPSDERLKRNKEGYESTYLQVLKKTHRRNN